MRPLIRRLFRLPTYYAEWLSEQRMGEKWLFNFHDSRIRG
jgi:hypothetical protein